MAALRCRFPLGGVQQDGSELAGEPREVNTSGLGYPKVLGNTQYGYGSIPIHTIFRGMNIHLPAILMFTRGIGF